MPALRDIEAFYGTRVEEMVRDGREERKREMDGWMDGLMDGWRGGSAARARASLSMAPSLSHILTLSLPFPQPANVADLI